MRLRGSTSKAVDAFRNATDLFEAADEVENAATASKKWFHLLWGKDAAAVLEPAQRRYRISAQPLHRRLYIGGFTRYYAALNDVGDLHFARRLVEEAKQIVPRSEKRAWSSILSNEALLHFQEERYAMAIHRSRQALELIPATDLGQLRRSVIHNLVLSSLALGRVEDARAYFEQIPRSERLSPRLVYELRRAQVLSAEGRDRDAIVTVKDVLESARGTGWEWDLLNRLARSLEATGQTQEAFAAYEAAAVKTESIRRAVPTLDLKVWVAAKYREPFERMFVIEATNGNHREALSILERIKGRTFIEAYMRGSSELSLIDPALRARQRMAVAASLANSEMSRSIDAGIPQEVWLAYLVVDDELWAASRSNGIVRIGRRPIRADALRRLVDRFTAGGYPEEVAAELGRALLPADFQPSPGTTVYVAADGPLQRVPFAALTRKGQRLVEDYDFAYIPSLFYLNGPVLDGGASEPFVLATGGDLPAAREEAEWVAKRLAVTPRLGEVATTAVLRDAVDTELLHFAGHSVQANGDAWLELSDGRVYASSVVELGLRPRMVVLASCMSAVPPGTEMWGSLAASFLASGTQNVVATLASVPDDVARSFVRDFYRAEGRTRPWRAVAEVQRRLLRREESAKIWAPFVYLGKGTARRMHSSVSAGAHFTDFRSPRIE